VEHTKLGEITSIKVKKMTRDHLAQVGTKSETYDDIINRLLDRYEKKSTAKPRTKGGRP
jgi:hypothetical protein